MTSLISGTTSFLERIACGVITNKLQLQFSELKGSLSDDDENDDGSENVAKNEFASCQTLSSLFGPAQFVK